MLILQKKMYNVQLKEHFKVFIGGPSRCGTRIDKESIIGPSRSLLVWNFLLEFDGFFHFSQPTVPLNSSIYI